MIFELEVIRCDKCPRRPRSVRFNRQSVCDFCQQLDCQHHFVFECKKCKKICCNKSCPEPPVELPRDRVSEE